MVDLAVGVIIGGAFGKIVTSLVSDIIMPLIGLLLGNIVITHIQIGLVNIGNFIQAIVDFVIIAAVVFLMVKLINAVRRKKPELPPEPSGEEKLLTEIRDLLREKSVKN